jgi:serine/threonine protein kinase
MATEIEHLFNLRHPLIAPLIGFDFPVESGGRRELKTARLHASRGSLADVLANPPAWWTPTAKAKSAVGIALALRFAHGRGLLHGAVKVANVFFDADRRIQIADFSAMRLESGEVELFSAEKWAPTADVCAFSFLLFEIAVDRPAIPPVGVAGELAVPARVRLILEIELFLIGIFPSGLNGALKGNSHCHPARILANKRVVIKQSQHGLKIGIL